MALRTPALWMGDPAVQHTAQDDRLMVGGLLRPEPASTAASRPLTATSGALYGPPGTMGEVTLLSNTQFTVNPARWMLQSSASALGGCYEVTNDAVATLGITAQDASQYRKSYWGVWVQDKFVAGSGDNLPHWGLVDGALAASAIAAALPGAGSLPTHFLALGEFLIPPTGNAVTFTPYSPRTALRGGVMPVIADGTTVPGHDGSLPAHIGQVRDHPTKGLQRGSATGGTWGLPNLDQPAFRICRYQVHAIPSSTWTAIFWDTEFLDTDDVWSINPSTQIIIKRAGWWLISVGLSLQGLVNSRRIVNVYKNAVAQPLGRAVYLTNVQADQGVEASGMLQCAVNDTLELYTYQDSGAGQNAAAGGQWATTYIQGLWIRP